MNICGQPGNPGSQAVCRDSTVDKQRQTTQAERFEIGKRTGNGARLRGDAAVPGKTAFQRTPFAVEGPDGVQQIRRDGADLETAAVFGFKPVDEIALGMVLFAAQRGKVRSVVQIICQVGLRGKCLGEIRTGIAEHLALPVGQLVKFRKPAGFRRIGANGIQRSADVPGTERKIIAQPPVGDAAAEQKAVPEAEQVMGLVFPDEHRRKRSVAGQTFGLVGQLLHGRKVL